MIEMMEMIPVGLRIFLIATLPFVGLQGSIPIALVAGLPAWPAFLISFLGNIFPVIFILLFLDRVQQFLSKHFYLFNRFFVWLFERTRKKHLAKFEKWREFALVVVATISGAWTGSLCAFIFGIPVKKAFFLIVIGLAIAGVIVISISLGIINFL